MENLQNKLKAKKGYKILIINSPFDSKHIFQDYTKYDIITKPDKECDLVLLFVKDCKDLSSQSKHAISSLKNYGLLWIAYPKKTSGIKTDLNRDQGWDPLYKAGFGPVSQIAIDETWSALRFRPEAQISRKKDSVILKRK